MYSKEENKRLKHEFWIDFAQKYPRKWMLYDTKIKDLSFKFYVDNTKAQVHIDIEIKNKDLRMLYFEKFEALKNILEEEFIQDLIFEKNYMLENGKNISRIWVEKRNVSISDRKSWNEIFDFFYEKMTTLESFYLEYDGFIKDIEI